MGQVLAHRGPNGCHLWHEGSVGLGHRMLWTTPESLGEQLPIRDTHTGNVITADVRLDNRDELINRLRVQKQISDAELILAAYNTFGAGCPTHFLGDFVFVIWDARKQILFGARDQLGVKHFYYYHDSARSFVFASEPKGIFCHRGAPRRTNELAIADHLLPFYEDRINTPFQSVLRLPAAHSFIVDQNGLRLTQYYQPDLNRELRLRSDREYEDGFRAVFTDAVRCRLRSAFPVGTMLSGGLDSSSIACVASTELAKAGRGPLQTFSGIFPSVSAISPKIDERSFAEAVVAKGGIQPHYVRVDAFSPLTEVDQIHWHLDNSLPATNMYLDWAIFKRAKQQGVRVLFSGNDGDSVVSFGIEDFKEYARRGRWVSLIREAAYLSRWSKKPYSAFKNFAWNYGIKTLVPDSAKYYWHRLRRRPVMRRDVPVMPGYCSSSLINPQFARRISLTERVWQLQNDSYPPDRSTRQHHWNCIASGMDHFLLESFEKAGGAHSLELRYPFFDRRVVEFCLSLPPGQRLQSGWPRSILRRSMEGILPPVVQWRVGKADMSANFKLKLLEYERETLDHIVYKSDALLAEYIDLPTVQRSYEKYLADPMLAQSESFHIALITNLALWLKNVESELISNPVISEGTLNTLRPREMGSTVAVPVPELVTASD
ncbi:MAG: asparagine synthetase B [Acidobacteria bacterium]|nr:MAG: asparagine synthetase B [Acidobacteriota bacterium]